MQFSFTADTDIGITKKTNQDSLIVKHAKCNGQEVLMAIVCDGMGGLSKGELASATVVRAFSKWFDEELPYELEHLNLEVIGGKWEFILKDLNVKIMEYGRSCNITMGTTFSGILFVGEQYLIAHVGDTRIYHIGNNLEQLTTDQTFIQREISKGTMTLEQAKKDKRRNMLLQCIGASDSVEPDVFIGKKEKGVYMLCSDGFRHELSQDELLNSFNVMNLSDKNRMNTEARKLIELVKQRNEKDNISVVLVKAD